MTWRQVETRIIRVGVEFTGWQKFREGWSQMYILKDGCLEGLLLFREIQ